MGYLIRRLAYEVAYYPYYILAITFLLLWLGEGVGEQSGWISCPTP
jgi:hypothetical protein